MEYICYISRAKIDSLHEQVQSQQFGDTLEKVTTETSRTAEVKGGLALAKVLQPFTAGVTYGRKDTIQLERKVKTAYLEKLNEILLEIQHKEEIRELDSLAAIDDAPSLYWYYEGDFTCVDLPAPVTGESVATLASRGTDFELRLDCSMRHFSESSDAHPIHSGNRWFFSGGQTMRLGGVFVLLGREGDQVIGTPLYLLLKTSGRPGNVL
ncbi:hypothetical protein ACIA5D_31705 [Actinoplanes sp. NPDC051513]|uniref:hypothetical protein n=1 Tax=Actinoplanes sp. NPDC051513 TaxID=3363908 RepID=UPI0037881942